MRVQAKQKTFNIYELFLHDNEATNVTPFSQLDLAKKLNEMAEDMCPEMFVQFVCPDDSCLSQWNIRFNTDRYECGDNGETKFQTYPMSRVYDERVFRRMLPPELDELLMELDKASVVL